MRSVRESNLEHIRKVNQLIVDSAKILLDRATNHDSSKLDEPEASLFESHGNSFRDVTYGSVEYFKRISSSSFQQAVSHHHKNNSHHVEYYPNGILGMNLFDLIEMVCDWKAACARNPNGVFEEHLKVNFERFNIPPDIQTIIMNTVNLIK